MKNINIEFTSVDFGWINFRVFNEINEFKGFFLQHIDPFGDFINWLEKVLTEKETYFMFNPAGDEIVFSIDKKDIFRISNSDRKNNLFEVKINRSKFVADFYNSFLDFFSSDYYLKNKDKWEGKTIAVYLSEHLKIPLNQIDKTLCASSKQELEALKAKWKLNLPIPTNWDNITDEERSNLIMNYTGKICAANPLEYKSDRIETFLTYNF